MHHAAGMTQKQSGCSYCSLPFFFGTKCTQFTLERKAYMIYTKNTHPFFCHFFPYIHDLLKNQKRSTRFAAKRKSTRRLLFSLCALHFSHLWELGCLERSAHAVQLFDCFFRIKIFAGVSKSFGELENYT